ncbi:inositol monophosphatase family protein [Amycolatopsis sp. cmx-4-68]|uniref:inositol monophosphatase family protein n=1 Tax=Amycolatopsis sp. cmx-4-68 TaxID=2790938 RepID=UPI00397899C3
MTDHLVFLEDVLREAAARASSVAGKQDARVKPGEPSQVVTAADLEIEQLLTDRIRTEYPGYGVLGEESGDGSVLARESG